MGTVCTNRSTAVGRGQMLASSNPNTSARCWSTPVIRISSTSPPRVRSGVRAAIAGSSKPPTAARRGARFSRSAKTRASRIEWKTGVRDFVRARRQPDYLFAASYQRRRHVVTLVNGGPECGIHRSTDGGKTWTKVRSGLPSTDMGRIGLAAAPSDPDTIYAIIEAADKQGGIFRSTDRGVTWQTQNPFGP